MTVNNIGTKIKTLVMVVTILGCIACVILFITGCSAYLDDKDYIKYATVNGGAYGYSSLENAGNNALAGKSLMIYSAVLLVAIAIGSMPMYGFGVLVENSEYSARTAQILDIKLTHIEEQIKALNSTVSNQRISPFSHAFENSSVNQPIPTSENTQQVEASTIDEATTKILKNALSYSTDAGIRNQLKYDLLTNKNIKGTVAIQKALEVPDVLLRKTIEDLLKANS